MFRGFRLLHTVFPLLLPHCLSSCQRQEARYALDGCCRFAVPHDPQVTSQVPRCVPASAGPVPWNMHSSRRQPSACAAKACGCLPPRRCASLASRVVLADDYSPLQLTSAHLVRGGRPYCTALWSVSTLDRRVSFPSTAAVLASFFRESARRGLGECECSGTSSFTVLLRRRSGAMRLTLACLRKRRP